MGDKINKHDLQELKKMVKERSPDEQVEEILAVFCERHGVSLDACRAQYKHLVEKGEIKEK